MFKEANTATRSNNAASKHNPSGRATVGTGLIYSYVRNGHVKPEHRLQLELIRQSYLELLQQPELPDAARDYWLAATLFAAYVLGAENVAAPITKVDKTKKA
jgi:hypothetical protein